MTERFVVPPGSRHVAVLGDAELDEGAIWEAVIDPMVPQLGELLWIVDVNRQSLDRIVPGIAAGRIATMFEAAGWHTTTLKYGRRLREILARPGGDAVRRRIDDMTNEEYQRLLRAPLEQLRDGFLGSGSVRRDLTRVVDDLSDHELARAVRDLGGHDLQDLIEAYRDADLQRDRPSVIFAYTIKAWRLPTQGHPGNHSALLTDEQWRALARELGADDAAPWESFADGSAEAEMCRSAGRRLEGRRHERHDVPPIPVDFGGRHKGASSTQQAFGRFFLELARAAPEVARHVVTVSPDVASSTNLGGWINRFGIWNVHDRFDWFADDPERLLHWRETANGQHIELGIAEMNLVGLLGELGATWSRVGQPLLPIGTIYDPFVNRVLEPWSFGIYAGGQSILVGTPSGVTLAPEGGAHQSIITPSVVLEQPGCIAWEPAFAEDLEWTLLHSLSLLGKPGGTSSYFRLSTRPLDQALGSVPEGADARNRRREHAVAGGYVLREASPKANVTLVGMGAVMPEVIAAADELARAGLGADVICLTSADLVFRALQAREGLQEGEDWILDVLFPPDRAAPIVAVLDGHPHTLSYLSAINCQRITTLGVADFGESGDIGDLYEHFGIDADTIVGTAIDATRRFVPADDSS